MSDCCSNKDQTPKKEVPKKEVPEKGVKEEASVEQKETSCCSADDAKADMHQHDHGQADSCHMPSSEVIADQTSEGDACCASKPKAAIKTMPSCCEPEPSTTPSCCETESKGRPDYFLWASLVSVVIMFGIYEWGQPLFQMFPPLEHFSHAVNELMSVMWWGILMGIIMVAILGKIPREFIISILGKEGGLKGIVRATMAGVLLDLCSHGILMVGAKLYERGATIGQVVAFLLASPWNSFSLTIILVALIGLPWTLAFIILSMVIGVVAGLIFDRLVAGGTLPANPNRMDIPEEFDFWPDAKQRFRETKMDGAFWWDFIVDGVRGSRPVLRWIMFGVLLAAAVRTFVDTASFQTWFGPSVLGLAATVLAATIIEVCSEGSTPIAADLLTRAAAPGNSFAFLMAGVSTDYTEIMVLKETTRSWKLALFLPLVTLPQVILVSWLINHFSTT